MKIPSIKLILAVIMHLKACSANCNSLDFRILGVISSDNQDKGIALIKSKSTGKVTACKVGGKISAKATLSKVENRYVDIVIGQKFYRIRVGSEEIMPITMDESIRAKAVEQNILREDGFEKVGDIIKVSSAFKESLINEKLSSIMDQASTQPFIRDGKLVGFIIGDIEKNSIYEKLGLVDGDIIIDINNKPINDTALAIKTLNELKFTTNAVFTIIRDGREKKISIEVQ
ncbi:MAG: PDZ domain-containing protein [Oligoflexales bacterium]|nr:PDZ domain-containing protein [Oligoflexales bacterium]